MKPERRRSARLNVQIPATVKHSDAKTQQATIKDISGHGMRLAMPGVVELGTRFAIEVLLPARKKPVTVQAEVVWSRPVDAPASGAAPASAEAGVKFVELHPKDRVLLMLYARLKTIPPSSIIP